jgi:GT2 family glycosyltransferase
MELARDVIGECVSLAEHGNVNAVIIPEESVGRGFLSECRKMEKEMRQGSDLSEAPRFFSRKAFENVGGYRESLVVGEDFDLGKRIENAGYKTERCKARIRHHEEEIPLKRLVLKIYYYGKKLPSYARKNPPLAARTSCPVHIAKNIKVIRSHPAPFVGLLMLKLVEYITYTAGALSNLLP